MQTTRTSIILGLAAFNLILGAPLRQTTEPVYVPEPRGRGTVGLLWSGLVTFGLCIWKAIHPDVIPCSKPLDRFWNRLLWLVLAAIFPEIILVIAFSQYHQAHELHNIWCEQYPDTMGLQGGFFVLMGGYIIQRADDILATDNKQSVPFTTTLTPEGFKWLLKKENLKGLCETILLSRNPFDMKEVEDKGKADDISKALVSIQALWMTAQCVARKLDGLPVTLLEIHVLIHIAYTAFIYAFW
ncbi:hypothetical protein BDD12DRAFT_728609, partial [Trichophaea hybrida]